MKTQCGDQSDTLNIFRGGKLVARGKHTDRIGRGTIEDFFGAFMKDEVLGRPKLLEAADPHVLSDHTAPVISILNLASVNDIERVTPKPIEVIPRTTCRAIPRPPRPETPIWDGGMRGAFEC